MKLTDYIAMDSVLVDMEASSKTDALQKISAGIGDVSGLPADAILNVLQRRESLGSTGIGNGIAIPHARISGIGKPIGFLARLLKPIDYDSIDDLPVDIIFALLTPDEETNKHLNVLAHIAKKLRSPAVVAKLRAARSGRLLRDSLVADG